MSSIYICGCVKNCGKYIDNVFNNINKITKYFKEYKIILAYDESTDNSLDKLNEHKINSENIIIIMKKI